MSSRIQDDIMIDRSKLANSFEFIVTAGARARQLQNGARPRVEPEDHKKTTIAAREVQTRLVEKIPPAAGPATPAADE
jgi:DNA-directed RNA polymerase omega subunit